jgi:1-aminocyclopropane-1-carboxylate deaminase
MKELGMHLHFVSRSDYRNRLQPDFIAHLLDLFPGAYVIPEGGAGASGIRGAQEMVNCHEPYDYAVLPAATGTTLAGIAEKLKNSPVKIIGIQVLKGKEAIRTQLLETARIDVLQYANLSIFEEYHHGGYAKTSEQLRQFADTWNKSQNLPLDWIYGMKAMYAIMQLIDKQYFNAGSRILYLHTGGLACT